MHMTNFFRVLSFATIFFVLTGCGFHLRGSYDIPAYLETVYISPEQPFEPFQQSLRKALKKQQIQILDKPNEDSTILTLNVPNIVEEVLAYGPSGQPQRVAIRYSIGYTLSVPSMNTVSRTIQRSRTLTQNNNSLLSNTNEFRTAESELIQEVTYSLIRQISTRPANKSESQDSSSEEINPC